MPELAHVGSHVSNWHLIFTPTTHFYVAEIIKIVNICICIFLQRCSCFVSSCFHLETLSVARCEPCGAQAWQEGRLAFAQPTLHWVIWQQEVSGTCFHMKIKTAQEEKHNIAQSDPECQNCNNRKFSPKMQPMRAVTACLVCPHHRWQEGGEHSFSLGQIFRAQPCSPVPCPLPCWRALPTAEHPKF